MMLQGFAPTNNGEVLVLFRQGNEEGFYPISAERARNLSRQLQQAIEDAQRVEVAKSK